MMQLSFGMKLINVLLCINGLKVLCLLSNPIVTKQQKNMHIKDTNCFI